MVAHRCEGHTTTAAPILTAAAKAILRARGFSIDMMIELVKAGLATTKRERMVADGRQTGVVRVRITDAGRQALAKMSK